MKRQLEGLEDRLEGLVQPRLADALTQRKVGFCCLSIVYLGLQIWIQIIRTIDESFYKTE